MLKSQNWHTRPGFIIVTRIVPECDACPGYFFIKQYDTCWKMPLTPLINQRFPPKIRAMRMTFL